MAHAELAEVFRQIAQLMTILGMDVFRIRAHERAAQTLDTTAEDVGKLAKEGRLRELPGVGEGISKKILEWLEHGRVQELEDLRKQVAPAILELMRVPGLGPKKAKLLVDELGLKSVADLEAACRDRRVQPLKGMGAKSEEKILAGIAAMRATRERTPLYEAREIAGKIVDHLKTAGGASEAVPTGSVRRWKETVRDIDILTVAPDPAKLMKAAATMPGVVEVIGHGETKTSVVWGQDRLQVDVRVVPPDSWGAALQYFTGSKEHNVRFRERANRMGLTVNEYGVFHLKKTGEKGARVAGETEESVYKALGLHWIPPELREDKGEIEEAEKGLPRLLERGDIRGDLHVHTTYSDGTASIEEMARAAEAQGYEYVAITDHSPSASYAGGLTVERIRRQWDEIEKVQKTVKIRLLRGTEADILPDGGIDWPDRILEQLDVVVAAIHQMVRGDREAHTKRLVRALEHPRVHVIGHPSTRRLGMRPGLDIDWEQVFAAAKKHGKALELNSSPERLDLDETHLARAKALGIPILIGTDSHGVAMLENIEYGVHMARRARLEPADVMTTRKLKDLEKWLSARRP